MHDSIDVQRKQELQIKAKNILHTLRDLHIKILKAKEKNLKERLLSSAK